MIVTINADKNHNKSSQSPNHFALGAGIKISIRFWGTLIVMIVTMNADKNHNKSSQS
jgi:hypothetical protein